MPPLSTCLPRVAFIGGLLLPHAALADLTAEDLWQHFQDSSDAFGGTLTATSTRSGDGLALSNMRFDMTLPFESGNVVVNMGDLELREDGKGAVDVIYPEKMSYTLTYSDGEGETYAGNLIMTHDSMTSRATGSPEDITFAYAADRIDIDVNIPELPEGIESIVMTGFIDALAGESRTTRASGMTYESTYSMGALEMIMDQLMNDHDGKPVKARGITGQTNLVGSLNAFIPEDGISLDRMASALRQGFTARGTNEVSSYSSKQEVSQGGGIVMSQSIRTGTYKHNLTLDAEGFEVSGPANDVRIDTVMPNMPGLLLGGDIASLQSHFSAPLLKGDEFAPARFALDLKGVAVDDMLWAMGDPQGVLPHDPIDLSIDLSGTMKHNVEWLDFAGVKTAFEALNGKLPVEPGEVTLNNLHLSAVGAEISGDGAFTFDSTDLESFDGLPRPEGKVTLRAKGVMALAEKLKALGIPAQQVDGTVMMLPMVARPDPENGEDAFKSVVEVTPEGHVLANGMRLK